MSQPSNLPAHLQEAFDQIAKAQEPPRIVGGTSTDPKQYGQGAADRASKSGPSNYETNNATGTTVEEVTTQAKTQSSSIDQATVDNITKTVDGLNVSIGHSGYADELTEKVTEFATNELAGINVQQSAVDAATASFTKQAQVAQGSSQTAIALGNTIGDALDRSLDAQGAVSDRKTDLTKATLEDRRTAEQLATNELDEEEARAIRFRADEQEALDNIDYWQKTARDGFRNGEDTILGKLKYALWGGNARALKEIALHQNFADRAAAGLDNVHYHRASIASEEAQLAARLSNDEFDATIRYEAAVSTWENLQTAQQNDMTLYEIGLKNYDLEKGQLDSLFNVSQLAQSGIDNTFKAMEAAKGWMYLQNQMKAETGRLQTEEEQYKFWARTSEQLVAEGILENQLDRPALISFLAMVNDPKQFENVRNSPIYKRGIQLLGYETPAEGDLVGRALEATLDPNANTANTLQVSQTKSYRSQLARAALERVPDLDKLPPEQAEAARANAAAMVGEHLSDSEWIKTLAGEDREAFSQYLTQAKASPVENQYSLANTSHSIKNLATASNLSDGQKAAFASFGVSLDDESYSVTLAELEAKFAGILNSTKSSYTSPETNRKAMDVISGMHEMARTLQKQANAATGLVDDGSQKFVINPELLSIKPTNFAYGGIEAPELDLFDVDSILAFKNYMNAISSKYEELAPRREVLSRFARNAL